MTAPGVRISPESTPLDDFELPEPFMEMSPCTSTPPSDSESESPSRFLVRCVVAGKGAGLACKMVMGMTRFRTVKCPSALDIFHTRRLLIKFCRAQCVVYRTGYV